MPNRRIIVIVALVAVAVAAALYLRRGSSEPRYAGFVGGEERVLRSEVTGPLLEVAFAEGDAVPAGAIVAKLDDRDIRAKIDSKPREVGGPGATGTTPGERT